MAIMAQIFILDEWKGKTLLDIGSGAYESFGTDARLDGVNVISVNPALAIDIHRHLLKEDNRWTPDSKIKRSIGQKAMRSLRAATQNIEPGDKTVAAMGQQLPFKDEAFDGAVSVFGIPHYLYQVPEMHSDEDKLQSYTSENRQASVEEIRKALDEVVRVLKPGGKAYLVDNYRDTDQTTGISHYAAADGSELIEALSQVDGITHEIFTRYIEQIESSSKAAVIRTTVITKL